MNHIAAFVGFTLDVIGKILVAISVLFIHRRVAKEHRIDRKIIREIRRESAWAIIGIALMVLGYILQIPFKLKGGI